MAETAYYLDEEDREFLNWLYQQYGREKGTKTRPETRNPRSRSPYQPPLEATHPGPKVYVALTPPAGLPALNRYGTTGTGTGDAQDDVPGEAECDIYRLDETPGTAGSAALIAIPDLTKTVYNLGEAVAGAEWVVVSRTESGAWVRSGGAVGDDVGCLIDTTQPVLTGASSSGSLCSGATFTFTRRKFNCDGTTTASTDVTAGTGAIPTTTVQVVTDITSVTAVCNDGDIDITVDFDVANVKVVDCP